MHYALVVDLKRCIGCQTCSVACKIENNLPNGIWWNKIKTIGGNLQDTSSGRFPNVEMSYMPTQCQHCDNPPCVEVCPVKATYKREDGIVIQDYDKCIGCQSCIEACPYGARSFNEKEPAYSIEQSLGDNNAGKHKKEVAEKCTFCVHRIDRGEKPACVGDICPARARLFGDLDDPNSDVSKALKGRTVEQLDKGTKPRIYYLK